MRLVATAVENLEVEFFKGSFLKSNFYNITDDVNSTFSRQDLFLTPMVFSRPLLSPVTIIWSSCGINTAADMPDLPREV